MNAMFNEIFKKFQLIVPFVGTISGWGTKYAPIEEPGVYCRRTQLSTCDIW